MNSDPGRKISEDDQLRQVYLLDYVVLLAKYKRFVIRFVGAAVLLAAIVLFLILSRWYKATAVVMPPKQANTLGLMSSLARATAPLRSLGLGGNSDELSDFQAILASRRVMEEVIEKFGLVKVYDLPNMEKTVATLESNVSVSLGKEDVALEISVFDTEPERAAAMANCFVETLNKVHLEMSVVEAKGNREFLEVRYIQNLRDLRACEDTLKRFQERFGVYSVPEQIKVAVQAAATLESKIALKEIELGILARTTSLENASRQSAEIELQELRKQVGNMKNGPANRANKSLVFPTFASVPEVGIQYLRHYRELELQGKLLELLLPLYEQAKIEEHRNTPSVIVLDMAVPPVRAAKPKRLLLLLATVVVSFLVAFLVVLYREHLALLRKSQRTEYLEKINFVKGELSLRNLFK